MNTELFCVDFVFYHVEKEFKWILDIPGFLIILKHTCEHLSWDWDHTGSKTDCLNYSRSCSICWLSQHLLIHLPGNWSNWSQRDMNRYYTTKRNTREVTMISEEWERQLNEAEKVLPLLIKRYKNDTTLWKKRQNLHPNQLLIKQTT